ncbi:MAG: response regulator [Elusimicrobia bacterium]|nr:response regulator [Elusimicrobiota bacterium]
MEIKRVLITDDSKFMRLVMRNLLVGQGLEVVGEAENVPQALEKYQALKPDLVTMDLVMPGDSGLKGIEQLRALDPQARVLVISALGQRQMIDDALRLGAKGFVEKPVKAEQLAEALGKLRQGA